ncbi:MAG: TetR/AcrR family transcriptional regulator [Candidatus Marinarcus sp.]|uniref:TetR/AcrR family transcriptional regulator n=1 Tax=Candidatus Marinarcus sp. TaxID=3100987 RepID=UPI003B00A7DE
MPLVVNKEKKRKCIALSCQEILYKKNLKDLTIAELAQEANIGKGTLYEYFQNKEEMVLVLITQLYENFKLKICTQIEQKKEIKEKIELIFTLLYEDEFNCYRKIFKEFIAISYSCNNEAIIKFQKNWYDDNFNLLSHLIQEGINQKIFPPKSIKMVDSIINTMVGFFILSFYTKTITQTKKDIHAYINTLFDSKKQ